MITPMQRDYIAAEEYRRLLCSIAGDARRCAVPDLHEGEGLHTRWSTRGGAGTREKVPDDGR